MAEDSKPVASPDWISKTLATLDAISGYTYAALASACGLVLFLPSPLFGVDVSQVRRDWVGWIAVGMITFALLALAKIARAIHPVIANAVVARSARRALHMKQAEVLAHLDALSVEERYLLAHCLANNEKTIISNYLNGPLTMLVTKGIFRMAPNPIFTPMKMPYIIPDFVWAELQRRKAEFPPEDPNHRHERLRHGWMAR
jgi:hypothetical protein